MSAEFKAVITLDNKEYEEGLQSAVKATKKFSEQVEDTKKDLQKLEKEGGPLQASFQKFGRTIGLNDEQLLKYGKTVASASKALGVVGAVVGGVIVAYKAYDKIMNSNCESAARWNDSLGSAKTTVDNFFSSLSTGDWSIFEKGIGNAIDLAYKYHKAMRDIKNDLKIGNVLLSESEKDANKYETIASNPNLSDKEREAAYADFLKVNDTAQKDVADMSKTNSKNIDDILAGKGINLQGSDKTELLRYLATYTNEGAALKKYIEAVKEEKSQQQYRETARQTPLLNTDEIKDANEKIAESQATQNALLKQFPKLKETYKLKQQFGDDDKLDEFIELIDTEIGLQDRGESLKRQRLDLSKDFDANGKLIKETTTTGGGGSDTKTEIAEQNSLNEVKNREAQLTKEINNMSIDNPRLKELIKEREEIKKLISSYESYINLLGIEPPKLDISAPDIFNMDSLKIEAPEIENMIGPMDSVLDKQEAMREQAEYAWNKMQEGAAGASSAVSSVGDVFSSLGGAIGGTTGEILGFVGTTAQAAAEIIPQIVSLIGAKQAEAMASGTASAAAMPFPANLAAIASIIATIIGVFASLPTFAEGGIFNGKTSMGDYNLARVNSGEMILNNSQQSRLFRMLNSGGNPNTIQSGQVQFRISGKELVGVLSNYNNKINRVL